MPKKVMPNPELPIYKQFDVDGSVYNELNLKSMLFVIKYWLEEVSLPAGKKPRYQFLPSDNLIRLEYERLLAIYQVDKRYVRFVEYLSYVGLKEIK
jgi:hypothetical protein